MKDEAWACDRHYRQVRAEFGPPSYARHAPKGQVWMCQPDEPEECDWWKCDLEAAATWHIRRLEAVAP